MKKQNIHIFVENKLSKRWINYFNLQVTTVIYILCKILKYIITKTVYHLMSPQYYK